MQKVLRSFKNFNSVLNSYGVNSDIKSKNFRFLGLNFSYSLRHIKKSHLNNTLSITKKMLIDFKLKNKSRQDIKALIENKSYKGSRHLHFLPVRGQRTRTNAKTQKKARFK